MFFALCRLCPPSPSTLLFVSPPPGAGLFGWQQAGVQPEWAEKREGAEAKQSRTDPRTAVAKVYREKGREMVAENVNIERLWRFDMDRSPSDPHPGALTLWCPGWKGNKEKQSPGKSFRDFFFSLRMNLKLLCFKGCRDYEIRWRRDAGIYLKSWKTWVTGGSEICLVCWCSFLTKFCLSLFRSMSHYTGMWNVLLCTFLLSLIWSESCFNHDGLEERDLQTRT